jgi:phosphohistidine phosphatase
MKLYLVQHGEASPKDIDPERPLTNQGRADVEAMAQRLKRSGIHVRRVIHSGKLRARQTAEILAASIAPEVEQDVSSLMNPNDNPAAFDWQSESWDQDTLIVGHLPFMARLVSHLLLGDSALSLVQYQPGSVVCLEHDDGNWQLNWMLRPELLK